MMRSLVAVVAVVATVSIAHADELAHPSGFTFALPAGAWKQATKSEVTTVTGAQLVAHVFAPKQEGSLADLTKRLPAELERIAMKSPKVGSFDDDEVAGAQIRFGTLAFGADGKGDARFAIVQRGDHSIILVGVPSETEYRAGVASFRAIVRGVKAGTTVATKPKPEGSPVPLLPPIVAVKSVTASSTYADKKDAYAAWRALEYAAGDDHIPTTAWCEGKPDEGLGESITVELAAPTPLDSIRIAAGVWKTAKLFTGNNRPTELEVTLDGKKTSVGPSETRTWAGVPVARAVTSFSIKLVTVAKGKMNDSCLSGIDLMRGTERVTAVRGIDAAAIAELPRSIAALQKALEARAGLDKLVELPFTVDKTKHTSWKSVEAACKRDVGCPHPASIDPNETRAAIITAVGVGQIDLEFPSHSESSPHWRLVWRAGAWRLASIQ